MSVQRSKQEPDLDGCYDTEKPANKWLFFTIFRIAVLVKRQKEDSPVTRIKS